MSEKAERSEGTDMPKSRDGTDVKVTPGGTSAPEDTKKSKDNKILRWVLIALAVIAGIALLALVLNRCTGEKDPLAGTQWQVRSYYNPAEVGGMASPVSFTQLTAEFAGGAVSGSSGCNTYSAPYEVKSDSLTIGLASTTRMACEQAIMDQEQAFLAAMQSAKSYKLEEGVQLQLLNDKGQLVVDFIPYAPMPGVTATPAAATPTPAAADDSWERIQAAGKIVVGTSADYPPFESYVGPGQIDGFDIALMDEIAKRLGVKTDYRDIAFESLGPSVVQGQVDIAIAAISRTPEREAYVDFSTVYLVGEGAALAQQDSNITLTQVEEIAKYKVGVQRNSVYQTQIQTQLIDTGMMPPDNLFSYAKAEDAVRDLRQGRVELAVVDSQPAQSFVQEGGVKIVGIGVNQQSYVIALPKGAAALKAKIDEGITALYNDGTISALSERYLGEPELLPTPTPGPTSPPAPTPACLDGLALVKSLTTEGDMKPGQAFTKGWQVKNTGTCAWTTAYKLVFASGEKMGGEPVAVVREVKPGETYDVQLSLVAPMTPGQYQGVWQMANAQGNGFGERLTVSIKVVAAPTVTPAPSQTPVPNIQFTVDRTSIKAGECVTFQWSTQNVKEVYFYAEGEAWQDHGVAGKGSSVECPPVTTTYYLRVVYPDNTVAMPQITINVTPAPAAPQITRFTVDPPGQITLGQCVTIRWEVTGDVTKVKLSANGGTLWDPAPTTGNMQDCPSAAGSVAYVIEATGPGGTSRGQQNINVVQPATATPKPTAPPQDPVIYSFSVMPNQIKAGDCTGLSWSVGGGATYTRITRNGTVIIDDAGFTGQTMDCLDTPGSYTYQLLARNNAGQEVTQQQAVSVTEAPPVNPLANTRWQVTAIGSPGLPGTNPVIPGTVLTMDFGASGELSGSSGCNTYTSTYLVNGSQLNMALPTATGMFCGEPEGIMDQEQAFLGLLPVINGFAIQGGKLSLSLGSGQVVVELVAY